MGAEVPKHFLHLLFASHGGVVDDHGIFSLPKRRFGTMRIAVIAVFYISKNIVEIGVLALFHQLVETALGTYLRRGGEEEFEFSFRKNHRADVATVAAICN